MGAGAAPLATSTATSVVIGFSAMNGATRVGVGTIAIGNASVPDNTSGDGNIGIGTQSCGGVTTGSNNIMIGQDVGDNNTAGDSNVVFSNQMAWQPGSNASRNFIVNRALGVHNGDDNIFLMTSGPIDNTTAQSDYTAIRNFGNGLQINIDGRSAAAFGLRDQNAADETLLTAQQTAATPLASYVQDDDIAVLSLDSTTDATNGAASSHFVGDRDPTGVVTGSPGDVYYRSDATNSAVYQHNGATANSTDWASISGGGLTAPANPLEDGYIPIASGGDVAYLRGFADGDVLTWNEVSETWESGVAGGIGPNIMTVTSTTQTVQTTGWVALSSFEFDPFDYDGYASIEFRALIETTSAADAVEIRIYNVDTASVVAGTTLTTTNTSVTLVSVDITNEIDVESSIYEVQLRLATGPNSNTAICKRAEIRVT
jgi:hypothetical protein